MRQGLRRRSVPLLLALVALVSLHGSCGGGGGGAGDLRHLFSGAYVYAQLTGPVLGGALRSEVGMATADGAGTLTFVEAYVAEEGTPSGPYEPPARTFDVDADRKLTLVDPASLEVVGRLAADGSIAALTPRAAPSNPAFLLLARRASAPTPADLVGAWNLVSWGRSSGPGEVAVARVATVDVDAAGTALITNHEVIVDGEFPLAVPLFLPSTITPGAGGWLEWWDPTATEVNFRGGMSEDRSLLVFGSWKDSNSHAVTRVLVRSGQAMSTADLVGAYGAAGLSLDPYHGGWAMDYGELAWSGGGTGTFEFTRLVLNAEVDGVVPITYAVGPTGTVDCTLVGPVTFSGAIGSGGRYAVLGGPFTQTYPPWHLVLVP